MNDQYNNINSEQIDLEKMKKEGKFDVTPETFVDFDNGNRYVKLNITGDQKKSLSIMFSQMSKLVDADTMTHSYRISFPEGIPHTLEALKQSVYDYMIKDINGNFVIPANMQVFMGAFTVMSIFKIQLFLSQISRKLDLISLKLDEIIEFLRGDKKAELISELTFVKYAYENFNSIMAHDEQRLATLMNVQASKKVAMKDIEFYEEDLKNHTDKIDEKSKDDTKKASDILNITKCLELSMQLYVMSSLLEMYYSQNDDKSYRDFLETTITEYIDRCKTNIGIHLGKLDGSLDENKGSSSKRQKTEEVKLKVSKKLDELKNGEAYNFKEIINKAFKENTNHTELYLQNGGDLYLKLN